MIKKNRLISIIVLIVLLFDILPFSSFSVISYAASPVYQQTDSRWKNHTYGSGGTKANTIGNKGCAVLAIVNAVNYLTGNFIAPSEVADWAMASGQYSYGVGSNWSIAQNAAGKFGLNNNFKMSERYSFSNTKSGTCYCGNTTSGFPKNTSAMDVVWSKLTSHLSQGEVCVALVPHHFIAIVDYDAARDKVLVYDSAAASKRQTSSAASNDINWKSKNELDYNSSTGSKDLKIRGEMTFYSRIDPIIPPDTNPDHYPFPTRNIGYYNSSAMTGDDVGWVQAVLYQLGYFTDPYDIDKSFGTGTRDTVKRFQADFGLDQDGSVGPLTRAKLNERWIIIRDGEQVFNPSLKRTEYLGSNRYEFYEGNTSWTKAKEYAESIGGYLMTVTSESEQNLIQSYYNNNNDAKLWLGATNPEDGGAWTWVSGEPFDYDHWGTGEPNNTNGIEHYLGTSTDCWWNDWDCETPTITGFIVEFEQIVTLDRTLYLDGHTYQFYKGKLTWTAARDYAEEYGGYLMTVTSEQEQELISQYRNQNDSSAKLWLGATDVENDQDWKWITGEPFEYDHWAENEPNNNNGANPESYLGTTTGGYWNDFVDAPEDITGFIVEYEPCVKATLTSTDEGHNYVLYTINTSWHSAKSFAEKAGGHLVTITSAEEQELIDYFISGYENGCYWFGAENESTGAYRWVTDEPWNYENWEIGEPGGGSEHYIATCYGTKWEDWGSTSPSITGFIVEYEPTLIKSFVFKEHTYEIYEMSFCPWYDAQSIAKDKGGHLVTITSALEQSVIKIELSDQVGTFWIGATDEKTEDVWEWVTGEGFNYDNWAEGEPNNLENNENTATMSTDGFWWDTVHDNYEVNGFIVEYEPEHTPGDINGDGSVNNKDLTRLMKYLAGEDVTFNEAALDVNGDGNVNNKDLTRLMKNLAGEDVAIFSA